MPPKVRQILRNSIEKEERLVLAISALKNKQIRNITEVARYFSVPRSTLRDQINSYSSRAETRANNHKITQNKEESLI